MLRKITLLMAVVVCAIGLVGAQTIQFDPAPDEDRVGFPEGYAENFKLLLTIDSAVAGGFVSSIYANEQAATIKQGGTFPYGSVLVQENRQTLRGADMKPVLDENGRYIPLGVQGLLVMRKEEGFGEAYQFNRAGEWEFVNYKPDGTYNVPPQESAPCAACHKLANARKDYVYRMRMYFVGASGAVPNAVTQLLRFIPQQVEAVAGATVTWYNDDEAQHRIIIDADGTDSGDMDPGTTFSYKFLTPGTYNIHCAIHPNFMKGTVVVK